MQMWKSGARVGPCSSMSLGVHALLSLTSSMFQYLVMTEASPGYSQWGWRRELVSCSRARIVFGNRQNPASLTDNIVLNWHNCYNIFNWYNHHFQDHHMFPAWIQVRIRRSLYHSIDWIGPVEIKDLISIQRCRPNGITVTQGINTRKAHNARTFRK